VGKRREGKLMHRGDPAAPCMPYNVRTLRGYFRLDRFTVCYNGVAFDVS
jgi:hypothetical protein